MTKVSRRKNNYITGVSNIVNFYDKKGNFYNLSLKNNNKLIGQWLSINNVRFLGEWIKSKYHNKEIFIQNRGTWLWPNGDWFSGIFKNGYHSDGTGKKTIENNGSFFGIWKNGLPYNGRMMWTNGNWFDGEIVDRKPYNGNGTLKLEDNVYFSGTFKNGYLYEGQCKYYSDDKSSYFEGQLKKGKMWEGKETILNSNKVHYIKNGKQYSGLDILLEVANNLKN